MYEEFIKALNSRDLNQLNNYLPFILISLSNRGHTQLLIQNSNLLFDQRLR